MNQKGFVIAPIILWVVGALVLTGTIAVKEGLIPIDLSEKITHDGSRTGTRVGYQSYCNPEQGVVIYENEKMPFVTDEGENVLWTKGDIDCYKERKLAEKSIQVPIPTSLPSIKPKPTQKPVVQQGVQANQNNQNAQGRTGRIVKYKEYCKGGKEISVYESELITKKAADGNTYSMTKDDWNCYEKQVNKPKGTIPNYQPTSSLPSTPSESYTPPTYYPCTICYSSGNCSTYTHLYKNKEECDAAQQSWDDLNDAFNTTPTPQPTLTEDEAQTIINQHNTQVTSCQSAVRSRYEGLLQSCNQYGGSSAGQACRQIYTDQRQREYDACGTLY